MYGYSTVQGIFIKENIKIDIVYLHFASIKDAFILDKRS